MAYVRDDYFDNIFNFEFSAVYLRERYSSVSLVRGGNWVSLSSTVEIEAKQ